jgi:hypothetical protein
MSCVRHLSFLPPLAAQPAQARAHAVTIANRLPLTSFADPFCKNIGPSAKSSRLDGTSASRAILLQKSMAIQVIAAL